jgi:hypothetical protein
MGKPEVKLMEIDPETARIWLEESKYEGQRRIDQTTVERYARDMRAGNWRVTGDTIKFTDAGELIDGQHRLWAVIVAEATVDQFVALNVEEAAFTVLDQGKRRTFADLLTSQGWSYAGDVAAMVPSVMSYASHRTFEPKMFRLRPTNHEMLGFMESMNGFEEILRVSFRIKDRLRISPAKFGAFMYVATLTEVDADPLEFGISLANGINLQPGDPVYALRDLLVRRMAERADKRYGLNYYIEATIRAWNAYARGDSLSLIRPRQGADRPMVWDPHKKIDKLWPIVR